jgi:hypothetical protein
MRGSGKAGRKSLLFLKKKKQKDFFSDCAVPSWVQVDESFLVLFFKKERACLPCPLS